MFVNLILVLKNKKSDLLEVGPVVKNINLDNFAFLNK
jgi:hypothetical protein